MNTDLVVDDGDAKAAWWPFCRVAAGPGIAPEARLRGTNATDTLSNLLLHLYPMALSTPIGQFESQVFEWLQLGIGFDAGWIGRVALTDTGPVMHNSCLYKLPLECILDWERLKTSDPSVIRRSVGMAEPLIISAHDPGIADDFRAFMHRYALTHGITCFLEDRVLGLHSFVTIFRHDRQAQMSEEDGQLMGALMPHIASAASINRIHQITQLKAGGVSGRMALAISDRLGILQFADAEFSAFMLLQWPRWTGPNLPAEISLTPASSGVSGYLGTHLAVEIRHVGELVVVQLRRRSAQSLLTGREREVAREFVTGLSYKEVARVLGVAPATVKHHLRNVYTKLGVQDKGQMAWMLSQDGA